MKKFWVLLSIVLLLPVSLALAQGDPGKLPTGLPDGTTILLPDGWAFEATDGVYQFTQGQHYFSDGEIIGLFVYLPEVTAPLFETPPTADELLATMVVDVLEMELDADQVVAREDGLEYAFEADGDQGLCVVQPWGDALLFYTFHAPTADFEAAQVAVEDILGQLSPGPAAGAPAGAPVECFVTANKDYGVPLRLGPGLNRGEYSSLTPTTGQVRVIGQTTADDGSLWWSIEENDASVNELWVADTDVDKTGSCNLIGQTQAGGVIAPAPGYVQTVPTPNPGTTDPNAPPAPPAAAGDVNLVPRSGTWFGTTADELLMSCEGGDTLRVPFNFNLGRISIIVSGSGDTLTINDGWDTFPGIRQAPGYYTANAPTSDSDMYAVWYLHVTSPTTINTELMVGFLSVPCSGTALISLSFVG